MEQNLIKVTSSAFSKIKEIQKEEQTNSPLRVFVQGGGCSGFQYGFTFEENEKDDMDLVIDNGEGVQILVDAISLSMLSGAEIDYKKDRMSEQFVIKNPNVNSTCGCGSSFSV
jgi:iron-sulfur cluster insertion protein